MSEQLSSTDLGWEVFSTVSEVCFVTGVDVVRPESFPNSVCSCVQARLCNNMQKARELWDSIMTRGNAKFANMWLEYYNLER